MRQLIGSFNFSDGFVIMKTIVAIEVMNKIAVKMVFKLKIDLIQ